MRQGSPINRTIILFQSLYCKVTVPIYEQRKFSDCAILHDHYFGAVLRLSRLRLVRAAIKCFKYRVV